MGGIMSMFCNKSRTAKLDQQEAAIIQCKITRDNIKAYIKRLEKNEKQRKTLSEKYLIIRFIKIDAITFSLS
jgi:hypothetical protein